jgi:hypothetical protein
MRISPDNITELGPNQIFVFGSNQRGAHGRGAAKQALTWGAKWGKGSGLWGRTYAIPTKNASITKTLSLDMIGEYVKEFTEFARKNPNLQFLVTEIGCGLAGLKPKEVAPLFAEAYSLENVWLPKRFHQYIRAHKVYELVKETLTPE